jgi:hypothetical protein
VALLLERERLGRRDPGGAAMSLKTFHLLFILIAIMGADLFGGWTVHAYSGSGSLPTLFMGIGCIVGGLGLTVYAIQFVRIMDREPLG